MNHSINRSIPEKLFLFINTMILLFITFICLFPFLNVLANAFSSDSAIAAGKVSFFPVDFNIEAIRLVATNKAVLRSMQVTVFITVFGTLINMTLTCLGAYPLSRRDLKGKGFFTSFILITMLFHGGTIPTFLVVRELGLVNTLWALILPSAISTFNLIVLKTFFQSIPIELQESAKLDGCSNMRILVQIVLPLSIPALATLSLFYAVSHWNSYFAPMLYIDEPTLFTLQVKLRQLILMGKQNELVEGIVTTSKHSEEALKAATIIFSTAPILVVYPWLQKYFVKGVTIGAIKG